MDTEMSWRRGGYLALTALVAMALYFLLTGPAWLALAMALTAFGLGAVLPRRRRAMHRRIAPSGLATGRGPR